MSRSPRLIRTITDFRRHYRQLGSGDLVLGMLPLRPGEEIKILDLSERGVNFFPPILSQFLSRSKAAQAEVLVDYMVPGSFVAYALADLAGRLPEYEPRKAVVAKRDRGHLGLGVSLWPNLETLYSLASLQGLTYPLVVQSFLAGARDVRVVVLGDYAEAYERINPHSFRKNLFQGGSSRTIALPRELLDFCREVMARGKFPYAILDLLLDPDGGRPYLSEISFKGGLTGARLSQADFRRRVAALEEDFCRSWENSFQTLP
ncbi:MAG: ATP-grasp domain-containing protein [Thermodesulfobacteriota bacterium]